ncbi:MAG: hypothetical protein IKC49_03115 [Clostridia bacterium]|nr:hypothetical protein [Clostridia bacterium]
MNKHSQKNNIKAGEFWTINDGATRGHKTLITRRKNKEVEHLPITHSPTTRKMQNIELHENPQKDNQSKSYILPKIQHSKIKNVGRKQNDMQIKNPIDKSRIRNIKKENKKR